MGIPIALFKNKLFYLKLRHLYHFEFCITIFSIHLFCGIYKKIEKMNQALEITQLFFFYNLTIFLDFSKRKKCTVPYLLIAILHRFSAYPYLL